MLGDLNSITLYTGLVKFEDQHWDLENGKRNIDRVYQDKFASRKDYEKGYRFSGHVSK